MMATMTKIFFTIHLLFVFYTFDSSGQNQFFPIKLSPDLPNNILATGYSGLRLSTQSNSVLTYIACNWVAVSGNVRFEQFFYANFVNNILCEDLFLNSEVQWNITCNFIGGIVNTSLIVISPLQAGFWKISIECREDESSYQDETVSIKINVSDCPSRVTSTIGVISSGSRYTSLGEFFCMNDGALFTNHTSTYNESTCAVTAQWNRQDVVECYTVPTNISIFGNLAAVEGTNVTLTCNFINANPSVDNVTFFADGQPKLPSMGSIYIKTLSRDDNNKKIQCRAINPFFNKINDALNFPNDGYSDLKTFNVTYQPFVATIHARVECEARCNFTIDSNPSATFVSLKNEDGRQVHGSLPRVTQLTKEIQTFSFENLTIPTTGNTTKSTLIVQSLYNRTLENTSLHFDVCNNTADGGCKSSRPTTTSDSINTELPPKPVNEDQSIIIIIATLVGVVAVSLISVGVFCWKRLNQSAEIRKGARQTFNMTTTSNMNQAAASHVQLKYLEINNKPARSAYEEIGGYQNVTLNNPKTNQQQPQPAGTPAPTYVNRNVINSETPYINASLQPFEKPHYVSINAAENANSSQGDGGYETFEPINQQPSKKK